MGEKDHSDKKLAGEGELTYVPLDAIRRVRSIADPVARTETLADVCRINTLYMIMQAGSGHIGSRAPFTLQIGGAGRRGDDQRRLSDDRQRWARALLTRAR